MITKDHKVLRSRDLPKASTIWRVSWPCQTTRADDFASLGCPQEWLLVGLRAGERSLARIGALMGISRAYTCNTVYSDVLCCNMNKQTVSLRLDTKKVEALDALA